MRPLVLVAIPYPQEGIDLLNGRFEVIHSPDRAGSEAVIRERAHEIRGVVTNGARGLAGPEIEILGDLEIILTQGAGYEGVDLDTVKRRSIVLANGTGVNAPAVADHVMALMLASMRNVVPADRAMHAGDWEGGRGLRPSPTGKRLGILGYGAVGGLVARRAAGFEMPIGYHNRSPRDGVEHSYFDSPEALAAGSDVLVVTCPGGAATRHIVGEEVLEALGPEGFLVNVSRGSNIDQRALIAALANGAIKGAAIDVVEGEPEVPDALLGLPNLIMTPHIAGNTPDALASKIVRVAQNLERHFSGQPVEYRVM